MITVYGRATSSNVQSVMWTVAELGLECERIDLGGSFGGNDAPEYRAMNPNGLVPTLKDEGLALWESAAVLRYLAARHGGEAWWPADPATRVRIDMWAEWAKVTFTPPFLYGIFQPLVRLRAADRDMDALARSVEKTTTLARIAETRLSQHEWMSGDRIGTADIVFGTLLYRYYTLPFERADLPKLEAYYRRLTTRPAYAEHVMVAYDDLRAK